MYDEIYEVISATEGCRITLDLSEWNDPLHGRFSGVMPLWVVLECLGVKKRVWVTHAFGELEVVSCALAADEGSPDNNRTVRRYPCVSIEQATDTLRTVLSA